MSFSGNAFWELCWPWLVPRQSKEGFLCSCGFGWRSRWNKARESSSTVSSSQPWSLQEAFKFNMFIIVFWLCRGWDFNYRQTRDFYLFLSFHEPPAAISLPHGSAVLWKWRSGWDGVFLFQMHPHPLASHTSLQPPDNLTGFQEVVYSWTRLPVQRTQSSCSYGPLLLGKPGVLMIIANRSDWGVEKGTQHVPRLVSRQHFQAHLSAEGLFCSPAAGLASGLRTDRAFLSLLVTLMLCIDVILLLFGCLRMGWENYFSPMSSLVNNVNPPHPSFA